MKELSKKKYVTLITIMILVLGIIGIVNIGNVDLNKGKVKLKSASIEKLKSSVIESKGYEEITYPVLYELEKVEGIEERNVIIKGILTKEENKYARFKEITSKTITSTVSENGREIEIKIEKVKLGRQNKINLKIEINGAINETKIKPEIEIKEESEKEYTKVNTEEIEVKTNSVTGLVQDEEGMSVSNLELSINKGNEEIRRTYTGENGRYVFSDVEEGKYIIKIEEENYELKEIKEVEVIGGITENIIVKKIKPYEIEVNKYISKIKLNNNGKEIEYEYGKLNKVNQTVKNLKNLSGEIEYKIEIKNTGEKSGEITKIEEEVTEGLKFSKEKNSEWEEKNGKIINRSLEGIKLKAGEEKEITLKLDIEKTDEARSYLQKVTAKGEVYQNVVYILGGKEYRKEKVLDGEKIEEPKIVQENFKGWYTDKKYTNKYNFKNNVTKDIILYGKIEESTKKYTVQYIDEGKIIKEEELEEGSIINAPEVTKEGYTFDGWYEGEEKYDVYEPITRNLILESKYEINKYKVRFINEDGSILQEETLDYGSTPTYKKETPTKKRTEEYTYEFDKWTPEITKVTSNQEYKATYKETKNKYTVTYINDGEEYHKETVEFGSVVTEIQDPTKEGYTFTGWYTKDNEKVGYPITVTKNITLYSKYEINSYKVSYYNEGKKYIEAQKINYGENALKPNTDPSKIGYTFKYWSIKENGEEYEFSTKITKNITLYAVYEINKYTVTYINEGVEYHKETAFYGSVITEIQDPTKEGYTFTGWYTKDNEKVSYPITVTKNITLYSKYEINSYKVSYYNEGKKYIEDQQINYGENALKPNTDPSKIGYTFKYWSIKENGEEYEFSTKITKNITLYAVYEINKYTVTYINEGIEYHKETAFYGSVVTEIQDPTKEGYTFTGWYTKDNEKVSYPITVTENITLYSKYEINSYKVSYYNEGKKYIDDQQINYGENALKPNTDPSKIGYTFKYWSLKENGEEYEFSTKITKDITLYAVYEINKYTVTYINEGTEYHKETVEYGSVVTSIQDPTKEGYTFTGWYNENNEKINHPITVTENITLHSKYEINTYTVSFYHNNEKYVEDQKVNYGENAVKPSIDPTKEDYNFSGWVIKGTNNKYDFTSKVTKDIELESSFTAKPTYTVTFKIGNEVILTENVIEGHKVTSKEAPYKKGYLFDKWYSDEGLTIENNFDEKIMGNKTIYGKYNENKRTVTYINEGTTYYTEEVLDRFTAKGPSENPSKEGYTFKYFSKDKKVAFDYSAEITENTTLYAVYEINKYTLTYINEESEYHKEELTYKSKHEKIEDPFKTGYTFTGWYNENEEKVEYPIIVTKDITLHSKYEINKYTVTFNDEDRITTKEVNYNAKVEPVTNQGKTGYTFKYWSIEKGGEEYNFNTLVTENITLYAVYEINKYTVTYINEESEYHKEELTYKSKHEKIEDPFKTGYTFIGWYNENEEKVEYPITVTKDITLHSKYEINKYTVTFNDEDRITTKEVNYNNKVEPVINQGKTGYTFKYWSKEKGGEEYNFNTSVTENMTLYAVYEINKYTVTYINEGSEYHKEELTYGSKHEKIEDPFKTGYTFIGWYNENEEKVEYPITVTKDITLHSKYEINKYTVTFNDEDRITTKEVNYNNKVEPVINQGKIGYTFKYWSVEKGGEEYNFNTLVTENITLYAVYEINTYKVIFKNYDGSTLQEETLEYRALPKYKGEVPTREKTKEYTYTFKGWDKEITEVTNNQEYIATYTETKNKYNVKFTNYDGSILQEETLEYGTIPVYKGKIPTKGKTEEYTYTFKNWNKEITEVTDNQIYIATYTETKNKYTVIYMDGEREYTRKEVNYGETVSEEVISKDHNIYRGWTLDGNIYDFNTPVTKNITIKSSFELVESPIIESTPIEWTKENVKVTITTNHNDYSYMYKIDDGEYQNYNGEFTVDKNCTVIAKSIKENVESEVTTKEITNIDKVLPVIKEIQEENITTKSFDIKVKGQDNESGLSEIRIYKNEELMVSYPYTERLNEEKEETYSLTGLEENTTYKIKVELIDKVGNINVSEEKEITTLKRVIVSRIIGRNNSLYESEEEYELFESLEEAITACGSNECTIEMVLDTKESVNVLEGQEIKLELNGKTVTGVRDYTIENSGELIIVDKEDSEGGIINNTDTAIKNIENGILQIGENEEPLSVSTTKPNIVGTTYGIYTEEETSKLKFYDGKIEGNVAIQGNVDDTPYLYNAKITNEGHQVATLSILAEAEAKITGGKYYTKLSNAVSETKSGTYEESNKSILSTAKSTTQYKFDYDELENTLTSNNQKIQSSNAYSYIKLDLTDYSIDQELAVTGILSTYRNYGYAIVTDSKTTPTYNQTDGRVLYMTGNNETKTETGRIVLEKGKIYYLHIGYVKPYGYATYDNNTDTFKITNITLSDYIMSSMLDEETNVVTQGSYGFTYQDGVLKSNNQKQRYTTANSYIKVDLTNYNYDRKIYIDAELHATAGDYGLITINNSEEVPSYSDKNGRIFYSYGNVSSKVYTANLEAGKVYYIHLGYKKNNGYDDSIDAFIINSITYNNGEPKNPTSKVPVLNEKVDTVELIKDITLTSPIEINETKEMILDLNGYTLTTSSNDYVIKNSGDLTITDSKYSNEQDKNQADYEAEQAKYDEEYNQELDFKNKKDEEYEKNLEEYEKKLEEYLKAHPNAEFGYTGKEETYTAPTDGTYKLETWGAQGGTVVYSSTYDGGYGGYSSGYVTLNKGDKLYVNVGGQGSGGIATMNYAGGYNGGGNTNGTSGSDHYHSSGGGATHISSVSGILSKLSDSLDSILIVSGGGGGSYRHTAGGSYSSIGGSGGGYIGSDATTSGSNGMQGIGGTQTSGRDYNASFGQGGQPNASYGSAGGGGFYGGGASNGKTMSNGNSGGGGGSGYIGNSKLTNKAMYCYNCEESSDESTKTISTTNVSETPTANYAKIGNGYAKITKIDNTSSSDDTTSNVTKPEKPLKPVNGYTTDNYVKDNIKLQLDGIDNTDESKWSNLSDNSNDGTINGAVNQDTGYYFDGSNDYVSFKQMNYDNVTVEATITPQISDSSERDIISNYESGGYGLHIKNGYIYAEFYINGSNKVVQSLDKYEIGKTYVVQAIYDGNEIKLYINNKLQNTISVTGTIDSATNNTVIMLGSNPSGTAAKGNYFKGTIHSARIYDRALKTDELYKNYNSDEKRFIGIIRKEATLKEAILTGIITSTTNSIIYNNLNANLTIKEAILNLNKSGEYDAITNEGTLSILSDAQINLNQQKNRGIYNGYNANIKDGGGTINLNSSGYGIYNVSKVDDGFNNTTFNLSNSSAYAFYNKINNITVDNIKTTGYNSYAFNTEKDIIINNSVINSQISIRNISVELNNSTHSTKTNYDSIYDGTLKMNNSTLYFNSSRSITGSGNIEFNDSNVYVQSISQSSDAFYAKEVIINNSNISNTSSGSYARLFNSNDIYVKGNSTITSTSNAGQVTLLKGSNIYITDNVTINSQTNDYFIIDGQNVTIGDKDGNVSSNISIESGKAKATVKANNLYLYDGVIKGKKENAIKGGIKEIEAGYGIGITQDGDYEIISLIKTTEAVAQIGEKNYTSLKTAIDEVQSGETIKLIKNVYTIDQYVINKDFDIDLNKNTIRSFNTDWLFKNSSVFKIYDSNSDSRGKIHNSNGLLFYNEGITNINNIDIYSRNPGYYSYQDFNENDVFDNLGTLNLENISVDNSIGVATGLNNYANAKTTILNSKYSGALTNNGDLTINSTEITGNESRKITNTSNELTIKNSTIKSIVNNSGVFTSLNNNFNSNVTNNSSGTFTSSSDSYKAKLENSGLFDLTDVTLIKNYSFTNLSGIMNINSGTINGSIINGSTGTINIYGGNINSGVSNWKTGIINIIGGIFNTNSQTIVNSSTGTINIGTKDGIVNIDSPMISTTITSTRYAAVTNTQGTLNFYDGTIKGIMAISGKVNETEDGYDIVTKNEDNLEIKYLAKEYAVQIESTGEKYYSLNDAINAVSTDNEIITLLRDLTVLPNDESAIIPKEKNITFDLNGKTISQNNEPLLVNNGTFTLKDSADTIEDKNSYTMYSGTIKTNVGNIIENNGTFNYDSGTITSSQSVSNLITNNGVMNMNGGYINPSSRSSNLIINNNKLLINNGTIYADGTKNAVYNKIDATLTINNAIFNVELSESNVTTSAIMNEGTIYINGGSYTIRSHYYYKIPVYLYNETNASAVIKGLDNLKGDILYSVYNKGNVEISNSTIYNGKLYNQSGTMNLTNVVSNYSTSSSQVNSNGVINFGTGIININSGSYDVPIENTNSGIINIKSGTYTRGVKNTSTGTINIGTEGDLTEEGELNVSKTNPDITSDTYGLEITSGTVNFYDGIISGTTDAVNGTINEIEDGYEIISGTTEDGKKSKYLSKLPVAQIESTGDTYYTLQEAIDSVTKTGETIKLIRNYTTLASLETTSISTDKNITIDLNGYMLEQNNENFLINNGTLNITDSSVENTGSIITNSNKFIENNGNLVLNKIIINPNQNYNNIILNNSKMTINNGSLSKKVTLDNVTLIENRGTLDLNDYNIDISQDGYASNLIGINNSGTLNIPNGTYKLTKYHSYPTFINNTGKLNISGGTYDISTDSTLLSNSSIEDITIDSITTTNTGTVVNNTSNEGTLSVSNSNVKGNMSNKGNGVLTVENLTTSSSISNAENGTLNINNVTFSSTNNYYIPITTSQAGTTNINGATIENGYIENGSSHIMNINDINITTNGTYRSGTITNTGTVNFIKGTVTSTAYNSIFNTGTVNIGLKDGNVSTEMPIITGKTYGVSNNDSGKVNFYDGIVSGESGAFSGTVNEVEPGYKIVINKTGTLSSATLSLVGDDEKVAVLNGINFTSLQDAINSASDTNESIITLYKDVTFESNITVPANKNIKLYLNGYTLNKGSYDFTGEGKITVIDGTSTNALANIMESVKEVLNIEGIKKNIIVYEMDDGSAISSESTYKLYKDNEEVILEEDAIGIYSVGNSNDEIRSANNKIYINELPKGKYKLIGDNNKKVKFEIDESGKIIGNVKENTKETRKLVSTAVAELIIMIQTGIEKVNYIMIILTLLVTISSLLYTVKKVNAKES